jgi:hypothetical protein
MDIARCRAVGVYGRMPPYDTAVKEGLDGVLVDMEPRAWVKAIASLATCSAEATPPASANCGQRNQHPQYEYALE